MRYSRTGIVVVLIGAEIFIAGAILAALGGHSWAFSTGDTHQVTFTAKTFDVIDAGSAPHVQIDDADSSVTVTASNDGQVHVSDDTRISGAVFASNEPAQLQVERTADGVRVYRPSTGNTWTMFGGEADRKITVAVPAGAYLEIVASDGADVSSLTGKVSVQSTDDVAVRDLQGDSSIATSDGDIDVSNVRATHLEFSTSDGKVKLRDVQAQSLEGSSSDGTITATGLQIGNSGSLETSDGDVEVALNDTNVMVHAHTSDGGLTIDGRKVGANEDDDAASGDFKVGSGGGSLQVATSDGDINITTNGAQ